MCAIVSTAEADLTMRSRRPRTTPGRGYGLERRAGPSFRRKDGVKCRERRIIDRDHDWYEKTIWGPDGSVIHHHAHPLRDHIGHGDDQRNARRF